MRIVSGKDVFFAFILRFLFLQTLMGDQDKSLDKLLLGLSNHVEGSLDERIFNDVKEFSKLYKEVKENKDALMQ